MILLAAMLIVTIIVGPVLALVALDRRTARRYPSYDWKKEG